MADTEAAAAAADTPEEVLKPVPRPDETKFREQIDAAQAELQTLQRQLKSVQQKISDKRSVTQDVQKKVSAERKKLAPMRAERDKLKKERKRLYDGKDAASDSIQAKKAVAQKLKDDLRFTNLNAINDEIRKLETEQKTTSYSSLIQEKAVIRQIEQLKKDRKGVQRYADANAAAKADESIVRDMRGKIREASQRLSASEKSLDKNSVVIRDLQKQLAAGKNLSPLFKEQNEIRDNVNKKREMLNQLHKDLRDLKKDYDAYMVIVRKKKYAAGKAEREAYREEQNRARKEYEDELAKEKPWMAEIGACDNMTDFLKSQLPKERRNQKSAAKKSATITLPDGTVITPMAGKGGKDAIMCGGGGRKKKRSRKKDRVLLIKHTPDSLFTFEKLKIQVPRYQDDIPDCLDELQAKRDYYDTLPRAQKKAPKAKKASPAKKAAAPVEEKKEEVAVEAAEEEAAAEEEEAPVKLKVPVVVEKPVEYLVAGNEYNMYITYSDDAALGQKAPLLEGLEVCQGDPIPAYEKGKTTVVYFWAKFIKDNAYAPLCGLDTLNKKFPNLQVVAIGIDPKKGDVERHIQKATEYSTVAGNKKWTGGKTDLTLAWENSDSTNATGGPPVKTAFHKLVGMDSFQCPQAFIIDENGVIVWRQAFTRNTTPYKTSRFEQQLSCVMGKSSLYTFGPNPSPKDDDSELEGYGSDDEAEDVFSAPAADGAW